MAATWDEIKRLAADFQRAQLSSTTQKLAERNCHEVVSKLVDLGLIQVLYTSDGKTYLTPKELEKEIYEEILANQGRVNLVKIQQSLNVDMLHIEAKSTEIVSSDEELQLILGQIIHVSYIDQICRDINDQLHEVGQTTFANLTKQYNLPGEFLRKEIVSRLGVTIFGKIDPTNTNVLYTDIYINRHRAKVRGIFSAVLRPTSISAVVQRFNIPEQLLIGLLTELIDEGVVRGSLSGNKTTFTPDIYTDAQNKWVNTFFTQNGYLEYAALSRLGISDPKLYIKRMYKNEAILLSSCCVSEACLESLRVSIEEALSADSYVNAMANLPSIISASDSAHLVQMCVKEQRKALVLCDTIVTTQEFVNKCAAPFEQLMEQKANKDIKFFSTVFADTADKKTLLSGAGDEVSKKDERKKKAAGAQKAGGGTQGREVKSKSTKNKYKGRGGANRDSDDDDDVNTTSSGVGGSVGRKLEFMAVDELVAVLDKQPELEDTTGSMREEIAARLYRPLRDKYQEIAKSIFQQSSGSSGVSGGSGGKRKQLSVLEDKVNNLYSNIRLYEKAINSVKDDEELQTALTKYLLKSVCNDLCNELTDWLASDHMITVPEGALATVEGRAKVISNLPDGIKSVVAKVHTSLSGKVYDEAILELLSSKNMGIMLKKSDKKKDRQVQFNHRQALLETVKSEENIPTAFHQAIVLLFGAVFQTMLHCTGKMMPQLVKQLKPHLSEDNYQLVTTCQELIIRQAKGEIEADDEQLKEMISKVKDLATTLKKSETANAATS